tara:strand:+ start:914 stop:1768 length:855 start_codon:yes stop_codon:yes gene_type:complete
MDLNLNNVTFIIVTYNSEEVINNCLDSIPREVPKIVIENSKNIETKKYLENKYDNIKVILSNNDGMGASNNKGISLSKTQFVFIINPDTTFKKDTLSNIFEASKLIEDFAIIAPTNIDLNYPNYQPSGKEIDNNIIEAKSVDGFSMLINKKKFNSNNFFDENFFLFLENDDLCKRTINLGNKIYVIKNSFIEHKGFSSVSKINKEKLELLRNWHWMWSKFYFNKKNYGFVKALILIFPTLTSSFFKIVINFIFFNKKKRKIYQARLSGILNSIFGKNSWYRIDS